MKLGEQTIALESCQSLFVAHPSSMCQNCIGVLQCYDWVNGLLCVTCVTFTNLIVGGGGTTSENRGTTSENRGAKALCVVAGSKQQLAFLQQQVTAEKTLSNLAADFAGAHTTLQVSHSRVKFPLNCFTCCEV